MGSIACTALPARNASRYQWHSASGTKARLVCMRRVSFHEDRSSPKRALSFALGFFFRTPPGLEPTIFRRGESQPPFKLLAEAGGDCGARGVL
jgi:hypothetical protein